MHLFGLLGTIVFIMGFAVSLWLGIDKLFFTKGAIKIAENPLFFIALTTMILGTLLFLTGFLAEMIARVSHDRNTYQIEKTLD